MKQLKENLERNMREAMLEGGKKRDKSSEEENREHESSELPSVSSQRQQQVLIKRRLQLPAFISYQLLWELKKREK